MSSTYSEGIKMSDIKLFQAQNGEVQELEGKSAAVGESP
jgi:hypothetical protein